MKHQTAFISALCPSQTSFRWKEARGPVCRGENVLCAPGEGTLLGAADSVLCHLDHSPPLQGLSPVPILQTTGQRLRMAEWLSQSYTVSSEVSDVRT